MLIEMPYTFPGKIFRSPMPFSRFDQSETWEAFRENGVDMVVVLTEQGEYLVYAGRDLPAFYRSQGLDALHIPVPDFGVPQDLQAWENGLTLVAQTAGEGKKYRYPLPGRHRQDRDIFSLPGQKGAGIGWGGSYPLGEGIPSWCNGEQISGKICN